MIRRGVLLAATALLLGVALTTTTDREGPVATVGHAGLEATTTTVPAPAPAPAAATSPAPTTTTRKPAVAAPRSTTVVRTDGGVTVVNEGSASVNTGGNTVVGPPSATVVNGPATAVGNLSRP